MEETRRNRSLVPDHHRDHRRRVLCGWLRISTSLPDVVSMVTKELAEGPARLATALDVDRALNGMDACAAGDTRYGYSPAPPCLPAR